MSTQPIITVNYMHTHLAELFSHIPQQPQRQDGSLAQLADLIPFVSKAGYAYVAESLTAQLPKSPHLAPAHALKDHLPQHLVVALNSLPKQPIQEPAEADMLVIRALANRLGLYDAADLLKHFQAPAYA